MSFCYEAVKYLRQSSLCRRRSNDIVEVSFDDLKKGENPIKNQLFIVFGLLIIEVKTYYEKKKSLGTTIINLCSTAFKLHSTVYYLCLLSLLYLSATKIDTVLNLIVDKMYSRQSLSITDPKLSELAARKSQETFLKK